MPGYELVGKEEADAVQKIFTESGGVLFAHGFDVQRNGRFRVRELEKSLAHRLGSAFCQVVSSGTAAQVVAMKAMGIQPGDEVVTQAFTFIATIEAIQACGATAVVVDVDHTLNMCPKALEGAITKKTKAIVPVHMLGNPARMNELMAIANRHHLPVLEDSCEALGATYQGKPVGTIGHCGFFSLDFGKTITAGEGGFILTNDAELQKNMAAYHDHGHKGEPGVPRGRDGALLPGFNYRMTEMQAAVADVQLKKLDFILESNRRNKARLKEGLSQLGDAIQFREITDRQGELADTVMFFLPNKVAAEKVVAKLAEQKIGTKNVPDAMQWHFAANWGHLWKNSAYANHFQTAWSKSAELLERCLSLPVTVKATPDEIDATVKKVIQAVRASL